MAERLGLTLRELYAKLDSHEIAEWMAYDHANSEGFRDKHVSGSEDKEKVVEKKMSMSQRVALYKKRTTKTDKEDW